MGSKFARTYTDRAPWASRAYRQQALSGALVWRAPRTNCSRAATGAMLKGSPTVHLHRADVPQCILGEGPIWSERRQCLYYVDILSQQVHAYFPNTRAHQQWQLPKLVGSLAECKSGGLIAALKDEIVWFDPEQGVSSLRSVVALERDRPLNRLNDGKADPWGRFWVGSMQEDEGAKSGRLWCVTPAGEATLQRDGIAVSNSIAFDRERSQIYFADSHARQIERAQVGPNGKLGEWTSFAALPAANPDGSCTDADSHLWNAEWGGARVVRYTPAGQIERSIALPVPNVTCAAFGGADFRTLFITSARLAMSESDLRKYPEAGSLYWLDFDDVRGLPADLFGL